MEIAAAQQSHQSVIATRELPGSVGIGGQVVRASTAIGAPWAHDVDPPAIQTPAQVLFWLRLRLSPGDWALTRLRAAERN
jgi:hypothetical protein